jgi:hypothetical protein
MVTEQERKLKAQVIPYLDDFVTSAAAARNLAKTTLASSRRLGEPPRVARPPYPNQGCRPPTLTPLPCAHRIAFRMEQGKVRLSSRSNCGAQCRCGAREPGPMREGLDAQGHFVLRWSRGTVRRSAPAPTASRSSTTPGKRVAPIVRIASVSTTAGLGSAAPLLPPPAIRFTAGTHPTVARPIGAALPMVAGSDRGVLARPLIRFSISHARSRVSRKGIWLCIRRG